jgi:hypothetical protein
VLIGWLEGHVVLHDSPARRSGWLRRQPSQRRGRLRLHRRLRVHLK